jgi:hypothetical protein
MWGKNIKLVPTSISQNGKHRGHNGCCDDEQLDCDLLHDFTPFINGLVKKIISKVRKDVFI